MITFISFLIFISCIFFIMKFIASITLMMCCLALGIIAVAFAGIFSITLLPIFDIFIFGLILGAIAFLSAKFFLFLIKALGGIGKVMIGVILAFLLLLIIII